MEKKSSKLLLDKKNAYLYNKIRKSKRAEKHISRALKVQTLIKFVLNLNHPPIPRQPLKFQR